jgi:hypothetical protein
MSSLVYFLRPIGARGPIKIGCTTLIHQRLAGINAISPQELEIAATIPGSYDLERRLHSKFLPTRHHGEWFNWSQELEGLIEQVVDGTFDADALPEPVWLSATVKTTKGVKAPKRVKSERVAREAVCATRDEYLLADVLKFLRRTGMPPSRFGRAAAGDPALVAGLRRGRVAYAKLSLRVRTFMEAYQPEDIAA